MHHREKSREISTPKALNSLYFSLLAGNLWGERFDPDCALRQPVWKAEKTHDSVYEYREICPYFAILPDEPNWRERTESAPRGSLRRLFSRRVVSSPVRRAGVPTEIYSRGRELHQKRCGPIIPAHLDPHLKRCTLASVEFEFVFDREPQAGDLLRSEDLAALHAPEANTFYFSEFITAWGRQLSHLACPLILEDGALFRRLVPERRTADPRWVRDLSIEFQEKMVGHRV